jgi:peptide/nickel transport system permease protein
MTTYLAQRLLSGLASLLLVSILVFAMLRIVPGDVATLILQGPDGAGAASPEDVARVTSDLGLDRPLPVQYLDWAGHVMRFDLGQSLWTKTGVGSELANRLPLTLELTLLALVFTVALGVPMGVAAAIHPRGWFDNVIQLISSVGLSMPGFWLGTVMIILLLELFNWTPPLGYEAPWSDLGKNLQQVVLPAIALAVHNSCVIARVTRSEVIDVLNEDYIRTARSKGLSAFRVIVRHALRNAALPILTVLSLQFGHMLGGTVVIETVFNLPGVGRYVVESINHRDYVAVQSLVFLFALSFIVVNMITDLAYGVIDPRIRVR